MATFASRLLRARLRNRRLDARADRPPRLLLRRVQRVHQAGERRRIERIGLCSGAGARPPAPHDVERAFHAASSPLGGWPCADRSCAASRGGSARIVALQGFWRATSSSAFGWDRVWRDQPDTHGDAAMPSHVRKLAWSPPRVGAVAVANGLPPWNASSRWHMSACSASQCWRARGHTSRALPRPYLGPANHAHPLSHRPPAPRRKRRRGYRHSGSAGYMLPR